MNVSVLLRLLTILLIFISRAYWFVSNKKALRDKPKVKQKPIILEKLAMIFFSSFIMVSLFGYTLFSFNNTYFQVFGFILVVLGFTVSILGRKELATNWTESYDYQIKKKHELVTTGIYSQVRHPIYGGLWLTLTGALIVSETYLFLPISLLSLFFFVRFAKREERLLTKYFGNKYVNYQRKTKQLIPTIY